MAACQSRGGEMIYHETEHGILYHGDCLDILPTLADKSVDLVLTDPPYNIGKDKQWDKWKSQSGYVGWCGQWINAMRRTLKDNGSFYFFHNDMTQIAMLMEWIKINTPFVYKQFIVWNKRFDGAKLKGYLDGYVCVENLRNYQQLAEYCLFYTYQDDTGLSKVMLDVNNFPSLRKYFYELLCFIGENNKSIANKMGNRNAEHCFYVLPKKAIIDTIGQNADNGLRYGSSQWDLPTNETYQQLIDIYHIDKWTGFQEYEALRQEYEALRYVFNNQKTHHSVWDYEIAERCEHITPKPTDLLENIIRHSSNDNSLVLDCFAGSGTTAVACINTKRRYILIEKEEKYCEISARRIESALQQTEIEL
jgi:site-specific DNA-methyltransferase (adenine-specific)